jgi:hypothetical protein
MKMKNKISIFGYMKKSSCLLVFLFISLHSFGQLQEYSEEVFKKDFIENLENLDPIEGIWNIDVTQETYHFDTLFDVQQSKQPLKIAIFKQKDKFFSYQMSGELFEAEFNSTDVKSVYLYRNYFPSISQYSKNQAVICKAGQMEYTYDFPKEYLIERMDKQYSEGLRIVKILKWSKVFPSK